PKRKPEEVLAAMDVEIEKLQERLADKKEIARATRQAQAVFAYGSESVTYQAFWMGYAETLASYAWYETYLDRLAQVSPKDVQRVAREYFQPQKRVVGFYVPQKKAA
ncbi:MAG: hypothetical protein N2444_09015, partial [Methylocystis sp.]|nr:hypothetical protein [Methylocystis sp.]